MVCPDDDDEGDSYDKFCNKLLKLVSVEKELSDFEVIVNWYGLVEKNIDRFKEFTKKTFGSNWLGSDPTDKDDDDFIEMWVNDFHSLLAGYASDKLYDKLILFVNELEEV